MARVLDFRTDDDDVLHRTDASGLFRAGHLAGAPLASYLEDGETARYLLGNRNGGITLGDETGIHDYEPDDDYRAFALVTDRRLLFVAGRADGDETVSVPLADVFAVETESTGLLSSSLVVETSDGTTYTFPCRGDLAAVVERLKDDTSAWSHAERLLENAATAVDRARTRLAAGDTEDAEAAMTDAEEAWAEALATLESVHEAAVAGLQERVAVRRELARGLRREIRATAGARAHASAQAAWRDRDYERAAGAYEEAVTAYEASLERPGETPTDDQLRRRIAGVAGERAVLGVSPVADAETVAGRAARTDDPATAAPIWERALDRYRRALALEWGVDGREFRVDREAIREAASEAVAEAVEARLAAGSQWTAAGDRLATAEGELAAGQGEEAAIRAYGRARSHVEHARALATEARPDHEAEVETQLAAIDGRLAGEFDPVETDQQAALPADSLEAVLADLEVDETGGTGAGRVAPTDDEGSDPGGTVLGTVDGPTESDGADGPAPVQRSETGSVDPATAVDDPEDEASPSEVADAIDAAEEPREDANVWGPLPRESDVGTGAGSLDGWSARAGGEGSESREASSPPVGGADVAGTARDADAVDDGALADAVRSTDPTAFTELVADLWSARGWATAVFDAGGDAVYDVLGVSLESGDRLSLWTCHRPAGETIDRAVVDRIAAVRDRTSDGARVALVTTGSVPAAVRDLATALDVTVVDCEVLCDLLVATGLETAVLDGIE